MSRYTIVYNDFTSEGLVMGESQHRFHNIDDAEAWLKSMGYFLNGEIWVEDKSAIKGYALIKEV